MAIVTAIMSVMPWPTMIIKVQSVHVGDGDGRNQYMASMRTWAGEGSNTLVTAAVAASNTAAALLHTLESGLNKRKTWSQSATSGCGATVPVPAPLGSSAFIPTRPTIKVPAGITSDDGTAMFSMFVKATGIAFVDFF